jgi:hypothetical protein
MPATALAVLALAAAHCCISCRSFFAAFCASRRSFSAASSSSALLP